MNVKSSPEALLEEFQQIRLKDESLLLFVCNVLLEKCCTMPAIYVQCVYAVIILLIEIILEVVNNGPNLNQLLKVPIVNLEDNCLDHALIAAVRNGNLSNIGKVILRGASHIDEALAEGRRLLKHDVTALLLIIEAAIANDLNVVLKLYGVDIQGVDTEVKLTESDDLAELQHIVCSQTFQTVVPIEMARRCRSFAVRDELLLRTDVDKENGTVNWHGLRLTQLETSWLERIDWVKILTLVRNDLTSLPPEMGNYLTQCTKIDLQCNKLCEIPHCLLELPCIVELNLSRNCIEMIPDVPKWSAALCILDLSYNSLKTLPSSAVAPNLKNLNISYNQFSTLPNCVCTFTELTALNIAHNSTMRRLPSEFQQLKNLTSFNIDGIDHLTNPLGEQK